MHENNQQHDLNAPLTSAPANTSQQEGPTQGPLREEKQFPASEAIKIERVVEPSSRKSTGPRTTQGKQRSKYNALKHGILSKKLLLKNESWAEFESLWNGLSEDFQIQGTLATELLMDLVMIRWKKRRLRRAQNAEIAEKVEFLEINRIMAQKAEAWNSEQLGGAFGGLLKPGCNIFALRKGIEILKRIRRFVEARGFNVENDRPLFRRLYGTDADGGVFHLYLLLAANSNLVPEDGTQNADPDKSKKLMVEALDEEIENLTELENAVVEMERKRRKHSVDQAMVLSQVAMERHIRYETHLNRDEDRILSQIERLERMQRGQPVPPTIKVELSR